MSLLVLLPRSKGIIQNISVRWASNPVIHIHEYLNGIQLLLGKDCEVDQIGKWEIRLDRNNKSMCPNVHTFDTNKQPNKILSLCHMNYHNSQ